MNEYILRALHAIRESADGVSASDIVRIAGPDNMRHHDLSNVIERLCVAERDAKGLFIWRLSCFYVDGTYTSLDGSTIINDKIMEIGPLHANR